MEQDIRCTHHPPIIPPAFEAHVDWVLHPNVIQKHSHVYSKHLRHATMNNQEQGNKNDWKEYFSKSTNTKCWESSSRKVRYPAASRSQDAVFKAGWVVLPQKQASGGSVAGKSQVHYWNVFANKTVLDIPEFVVDSGYPQTTRTAPTKKGHSKLATRTSPSRPHITTEKLLEVGKTRGSDKARVQMQG